MKNKDVLDIIKKNKEYKRKSHSLFSSTFIDERYGDWDNTEAVEKYKAHEEEWAAWLEEV